MRWQEVVVSIPGVCGGRPILKGHRIEVHNLVSDLAHFPASFADWIEKMDASDWISPEEVLAAVEFCVVRNCRELGVFCCNCTMNSDERPLEDPDYGSETDGWQLASEALEKHRQPNTTWINDRNQP
jgi:uncharacterized protein (DUF433 family)